MHAPLQSKMKKPVFRRPGVSPGNDFSVIVDTALIVDLPGETPAYRKKSNKLNC